MLDHHAIPQVTRELRAQREGEAEAHRLVLEARGRGERRAWRQELARELQRRLALFAAPNRRAGTSC